MFGIKAWYKPFVQHNEQLSMHIFYSTSEKMLEHPSCSESLNLKMNYRSLLAAKLENSDAFFIIHTYLFTWTLF